MSTRTFADPGARLARALSLAGLVALSAVWPAAGAGQGRTVFGLRGGAGLVSGSKPVYAGQIEIVDVDRAGSVELAVTAWSGLRLTGEYTAGDLNPNHAHPERMEIWGGGVVASYLWRHGRRWGPYALLGIGLGPVWVDWRADSTDPFFGSPILGGSFRAERIVTVGSLLSAGLGQRLYDHFDLRAQLTIMIVPSTNAREDVRKIPMLTLTSGIGL